MYQQFYPTGDDTTLVRCPTWLTVCTCCACLTQKGHAASGGALALQPPRDHWIGPEPCRSSPEGGRPCTPWLSWQSPQTTCMTLPCVCVMIWLHVSCRRARSVGPIQWHRNSQCSGTETGTSKGHGHGHEQMAWARARARARARMLKPQGRMHLYKQILFFQLLGGHR